MTEYAYVRAIRDFFTRLPQTSGRFSRSDRHLAADLFKRHVPFDVVRSAMLLATVTRLYRNGPPLPIIRSLHYFLPLVDDILRQPLPPGYVQYLEHKLRSSK